jgi:hypothetical protein
VRAREADHPRRENAAGGFPGADSEHRETTAD